MKRHFLAFCLISVVLLAAALVFYSCSASDFLKQINGTLTVTPSDGFVGTTFYAFYQGKDGDKIDGFYWSYENGSGSGSGSPYPGQKYSSMFTATHAGKLHVNVQVNRLGYKGIRSDRINVYVDPNAVPPPTITKEEIEVTSEGRLTITGLEEKYHNWKIIGITPEESPLRICACQGAYNTYEYQNGSLSKISTGRVIPDTFYNLDINSSTYYVLLKLFIINNNRYEAYTGNDKNVTFDVKMGFNNVYLFGPKNGTVTVSFTNGVGSGVFVPNP